MLLAALCASPARPALGQTPAGNLSASVVDLGGTDFARRAAALEVLGAAGVAGAQAALVDFKAAPVDARAARARVVRLHGDGSLLEQVLGCCSDPSPAVRAEFAGYLGRALREHPAVSAALSARSVAFLTEYAAKDAEGTVRMKALESLSRADSLECAQALAELTRTQAGPEAALAARALSNAPRGGELLVELVQASFDAPGRRLSEPALAVLLAEGYGPALAEAERGGLDLRSRRPLFLGGRDVSSSVRAASMLAFQGFLARAHFLGAIARAEEVAAALAGEVEGSVRVLQASVVFTLTAGSVPEHALVPLQRLTALLGVPDQGDARARFDLAVTHTLAAVVRLANGQPELATSRLEAARTLLAGLAGEGLDRAGELGSQLASEVAAERAVVESYALLALLRKGAAVDAPECRRIARALHELSLRAQLLQTLGPLTGWTGDLDSLAQHPHGPFDLLLANPELEPSLGAHPLDLALALARALATEAPDELPGFGPPGAAAPLDETRQALVSQIEVSRLEQVQRELARLPPEAAERVDLENALRVLGAELSSTPDLHRVRLPSALSIELSGNLRDEGRTAEARALAASAKEALSRADFLFGGPYVQELIARAESTLGACATDEGKPEEADKLLNGALDRLAAIATNGNDDLRSKAARSNVLVSLAVNANVKWRDTTKALAYFERAFELRQDDFTRTLLACYRARAGRSEEARALLREVPESPFNYYNLACTYALLGDKELALDYLTRELQGGKKSAGAIERQRIWARTDPDLDNLRGDEHFAALVGK